MLLQNIETFEFRYGVVVFTLLAIAASVAGCGNDGSAATTVATEPEPSLVDIGSRRELFIDDYLLEGLSGDATLNAHRPVARNVSLVTDMPWEGNYGAYATVMKDGDRYRFYYSCLDIDIDSIPPDGLFADYRRNGFMCYAESADGLNWTRVDLGLYDFEGSVANNIVWDGDVGKPPEVWAVMAPFLDTNPAAAADAKYKAIARSTRDGIYALKSPDAIHWTLMHADPILVSPQDGRFDSNNFAFWDPSIGQYRIYVRDLRPDDGNSNVWVANGDDYFRDVRTAVSDDFLSWSPRPPDWLQYPGAHDEHLYTFPIEPYALAPHIYVGLPVRYVYRPQSASAVSGLPEQVLRQKLIGIRERLGTALTESVIMTSRDGRTFNRRDEAFIRPGPQQQGNWVYGDNFVARGMIETPSNRTASPNELSFYATENILRGGGVVWRRHSIRIDGFASLSAGLAGGEAITKPFTFNGSQLQLNVETSAVGRVRVEIQSESGVPLNGFTLEDCDEIVGDDLGWTVRWSQGSDVSALTGSPVRLRIVMQDADVYSFQFRL